MREVLCNTGIVTEFDTPMKVFRCSVIQGYASSSLFFHFSLEHIRKVQEKQDGFKLNGIHKLLVYVDAGNILVTDIDAIEINTEALLVTSKEADIEVNVEKTKYRFMS
jgi:hypothetical protein